MPVPSSQQRLNILATNVTVTNASAQAIASSQIRGGIMFHNPSATASVAICPVSFGPAVLNGGGCITLGPLGTLTIDTLRTLDAFNAISSVASSPLTVWEF